MFITIVATVLLLANVEAIGNSLHKFQANPSFHFDLQQTNCPNQPIPVPFKKIPDEIVDALLQLEMNLSKLAEVSGIPGVSAVAVYGQETIWNWSFGTKDKNTGIPPDPTTIFRLGSVSKLFPTIAMYQLLQWKVIESLDDPISKYAPNFSIKNPFYPGSQGITFRQVASQLSGLPRECPCVLPCNETSDTMFERIAEQYLIFPPYTRPSYSNLGFSLLGRVIEAIVGFPFEDYVEQFILIPLGLVSTGFKFTDDIINQMATGYLTDGSVAPIIDIGWAAPAGQMYSNAEDMASLMKFLLAAADTSSESPVVDSSLLMEMMSPIFLNPDQTTLWGTPWEIKFQDSYLVRRKDGNINGYSTIVSVIPELQLGVSFLFNYEVDGYIWTDAFYENLIPVFTSVLSTLQPPISQPPNPEAYIGTYSGIGVTAVVAQEKNMLTTTVYVPGQLTFYLRYVLEGVFQLHFPGGLDCVTEEEMAAENEYLFFGMANGVATNITIPSLMYGLYLQKS